MSRGGSTAERRRTTVTRRLHRWLGASLVLVSSLVVIAPPAPAHAHVELVSSSPEAGARVPLTSGQVTLVFGEDLFPIGSDISVRGPDGAEVTRSDPTTSGPTLEAPMVLVAAGRHLLSYRAVGQDGHVIAGDLWFTVAAEGLPLPSAAAAPTFRTSGSAADADDRAQLISRVTSVGLLVGAAIVLGGLVVRFGAGRHTKVAVRARRDDG